MTPNHPLQATRWSGHLIFKRQVSVVAIDNYAYLVPFVEEDDYYFLKTVIPSRKAKREQMKEGESNGET